MLSSGKRTDQSMVGHVDPSIVQIGDDVSSFARKPCRARRDCFRFARDEHVKAIASQPQA
jgi:hypothetical protein